MNQNLSVVITILLVGHFAIAVSAVAREHHVSTPDELSAALRRAIPGDTLVLADGIWMDADILFEGRGAADAPITLRAETPGKAILRGTSVMRDPIG